MLCLHSLFLRQLIHQHDLKVHLKHGSLSIYQDPAAFAAAQKHATYMNHLVGEESQVRTTAIVQFTFEPV